MKMILKYMSVKLKLQHIFQTYNFIILRYFYLKLFVLIDFKKNIIIFLQDLKRFRRIFSFDNIVTNRIPI